MDPPKQDSNTRHVSFILVPGFPITPFALAVEALSVVNQLSSNPVYDYHLYSGDHDPGLHHVVSSNNVPVQVAGHFSQCPDSSLVVICAYKDASAYHNSTLFAKLRSFRQAGAQLAAVSGGSFILARAGLLETRSCTLFRDQAPTFRELYPDINIQENIYTVSQNTFTCAGGTTALDMMLYIIGRDRGTNFANNVGHQFSHDGIRSPEEMQNSRRYLELRMRSPCLGAAIEVMERNIEHPYSIQLLAEKIGTTTRTLEQAFKAHTNTTPVNYYLQVRLDRARKMIEETRLPISTISQATGFTSQSYFTKRFRELYQISPGQLRSPKSL